MREGFPWRWFETQAAQGPAYTAEPEPAEPGRDTASRLSALRKLFSTQAVENLDKTPRWDVEAAEELSAKGPTMHQAIAPPPEPAPVAASKGPQPEAAELLAPRRRVRARLERDDYQDEVRILPSRRGQYKQT